MARALREVGRADKTTERLREAVEACRAALAVVSQAAPRRTWDVNLELAAALRQLARRVKGTAALKEAVSACRHAVSARDARLEPRPWAVAQLDLARALYELGARQTRSGTLDVAAEVAETARETFERLHAEDLASAAYSSLLGEIDQERGRRRAR